MGQVAGAPFFPGFVKSVLKHVDWCSIYNMLW